MSVAETADLWWKNAVIYCLGPNPDMIKLVRRELDDAVKAAGRPEGSVKLVSLSWFYQLENGETWEDGVDHGFGSGPISSCITNAGFMNDHVDELGERIVTASTNAAKAYLGDPTAPDAPHYLEVWAKYLRGLDPVHRDHRRLAGRGGVEGGDPHAQGRSRAARSISPSPPAA